MIFRAPNRLEAFELLMHRNSAHWKYGLRLFQYHIFDGGVSIWFRIHSESTFDTTY